MTDHKSNFSDNQLPFPKNGLPPFCLPVGDEGTKGGEADRSPLLYQYSNNSDGTLPDDALKVSDFALQTANLLTNYHRKQACTLASNVERLFSLVPSPGHVGFLTLTFKENLIDYKEASRRFDNLRKKLLNENPNFGIWIRATERQKRGAVHYHLVIETKEDIRSGFDWNLYGMALQAKSLKLPGWRKKISQAYGSANDDLRYLWKLLRSNMEQYGFGRSEILPIRSCPEAMSLYVGKYISKHIGQREERDLGMRLISYSQGWIKNSVKLSWVNDNARQWRKNVQTFANYTFGYSGNPDLDHFRLRIKFGPKWAWKYRAEIYGITETVSCENQALPF